MHRRKRTPLKHLEAGSSPRGHMADPVGTSEGFHGSSRFSSTDDGDRSLGWSQTRLPRPRHGNPCRTGGPRRHPWDHSRRWWRRFEATWPRPLTTRARYQAPSGHPACPRQWLAHPRVASETGRRGCPPEAAVVFPSTRPAPGSCSPHRPCPPRRDCDRSRLPAPTGRCRPCRRR